MRMHRSPGGAVQSRTQSDIELIDDRRDRLWPAREKIEDPGFTFAAVRDKCANMRMRLVIAGPWVGQ